MLAPLIALLAPPPGTPPAPAPQVVRVWLDQRAPLSRGMSVRVYVEAAQDGNLVVLHRRTDGRVEALFPRTPGSDPFVRAGTYEIRGSGDRAAWVVAEPDGNGMVLAALSSDPLRFDEFVRAATWNEDALGSIGSGSEPEGALSDVVQRMLGDGALSYDVVSYTVAPPVYALQEGIPQDGAPQTPTDTMPGDQADQTCPNCPWNGVEVVVVEPFYPFPPFFWRRAFEPDLPAPATPMQALALTLGARPGEAPGVLQLVSPRHSEAAPPHVPAGPTPIAPRPRAPAPPARPAAVPVAARPAVRPLPAGPVRRPELASGGPLTHVRFTRLSAPAPEAPTTTVRDSRSAGSGSARGGATGSLSAGGRGVASVGAGPAGSALPRGEAGTRSGARVGGKTAPPDARPRAASAPTAQPGFGTPFVIPPASARSAGVGLGVGAAAPTSRGAARSGGGGRRR
jgi:Domain of unknown function (DUF4384)